MHHDPQFYKIRNHLVDFLVNRSKLIASGAVDQLSTSAPTLPPIVTPGLEPAPPAPNEPIASLSNPSVPAQRAA